MKLATLRRMRSDGLAGVSGVARLDRRTKRLVGRLNPGDIAIIDHVDLDRVAAESLVAAKVGAVVNAQPSISGRYPNLGPDLLVASGVPLLDNVGNEIFAAVKEGMRVRLDGDTLYIGEQFVAKGTAQDSESIASQMGEAKSGLSTQLEAFANNTMEYMKRERALLLDGVGVPVVHTKIEGRHALVVVRGYDYKQDLAALRHYIHEYKPVLIGADGRAPGLARVQDLGIDAVTFPAMGTSEDIAMLLADEKGAALIVAVGTHATLVEFLDKGRGGMASTFLTRLRLGGKLVDAKRVSRLYRSRISSAALLLLVLAAFIAIGAALAVSEAGRTYLDIFGDKWDRFVAWLGDLFS